jgi:hypothetical protein
VASRKWTHTAWKYTATFNSFDNPIIPYLNTNALTLGAYDASCATGLTAVRTMYQFTLAGTIVLNSNGKTNTSPGWWADLSPVLGIECRPFSLSPGTNPWGGGAGETHAVASCGLEVSFLGSAVDNATGDPTQTVLFQTAGSTEGMRTLAGPADLQTIATLGFDYNSYAAGYGGVERPVHWYYTLYMKTLFGGSTTIT